jgi:hypothetical protein
MKMKSSGSAFEIARNAAKLFSLLLDYYIWALNSAQGDWLYKQVQLL